MARDYEDLYDLDNIGDEDLRDLIRQEIGEYPDLDPDLVDIQVKSGFVTLNGRVGTEQELQEIEHVVSDVLGIKTYSNELVIDEIVRAESSEAADEANAEAEEVAIRGGAPQPATSPEAEHLQEDLDAELYGTSDLKQAIEEGHSYNPPDRPVQEGSWSEENH